MKQNATLQENIDNILLLDIATRNVISLTVDDCAGNAAQIMSTHSISSILLTDDAGHPAGIVTERNILHAMQSGIGLDTALRDIMSAPLISVPTDITALEAYRLCQEKNIRHLAIVDDSGALAGMVSETDFRLHLHLGALAGRRKIASVARRSGISLPPSACLSQALALMLAQHKSCVVVVEDRKPVGIITERDVVRFYSTRTSAGDMVLRDAMTSPVLTISGDAPASESAELMLVSKVRHLVVVDEAGCVIGLLNEHDLTGMMTSGAEERGGIEASFLRLLVNTLPDLIWLKDREGRYLACNARFEKFLGQKEQYIVGKSDYDFVSREEAELFREHDRTAMENEAPTVNEEWITFADDGHRELLETIKTPMRNRDGELIGVLGIARDITARKQLETDLERSERKLHDIYDSVDDCIEIISADGHILDMNRIGYERLGYTREEMVGRKLSAFSPPEFAEQVAERIAQIRLDGYATFESGRVRKDGTVMPLEVRSRLVQLDGEDVFLGISRDITVRKRTEDALRFIAQRNATENPESILTEIARYLGKALEVDYVIIDRLAEEVDMAETVALYAKGNIAPNMRYALKDTPCDNVMGKEMCCYDHDVQRLFPKDGLLEGMGADSYAGMPLWDSGGQPIGLIAVLDGKPFADEKGVTNLLQLMASRAASELERARNEQFLRAREQDLRQALQLTESVINAIPDLLFELDSDGRYLNVWAHDPDLLAAQKELLLGHTVAEMLSPQAAEIVTSAIEQAIAHGTSGGQVISLDLPQGRSWFELSTAAKPATDDACRHVLMLSRDITSRMEAEAKLHDSHAKLSGLYSLSPMGIALTDMQGRYVEFNESFRDICGYTRDELNELDYWDLTPREYAEQEAAQLELLNSKGYYGPYEKEYIRKGGVRIPLRLNGVLIHGSDGQPYIWSIVEDITERKRAEDMLRKLSAAVEQSAASVVITDLAASIQYVNPHFTVATGYGADEAMGQNPRFLQSGQTPKETYDELWAKLTNGQEWSGELLNKRKNGELYWEDVSIAPIRDGAGAVTHYVAIKTEITARKMMETALAESERRYRSLVENSPFCIHEIGLDGRLLSMNQAGLCMLDLDGEEKIRGVSYLSAVGEQDSARIGALLRAAFDGKPSHFEFIGAGAEPLHFKSCFIPIHDAGGRVVKLMGISEDITERKRAEQLLLQDEAQLREQKEFLGAVFENALDAVVLMDERGTCTRWNHQAEAIFGWKREEAVGRPMHELIVPEHHREAHVRGMKHFLTGGEGPVLNRRIEVTAIRRDGTEFPVELSIAPIRTADGYEFSSFIRDITERQHMERQVQESEELFRAVFTQAPSAVELIDPDTLRFIEANPAACTMLGYTREEYLKLRLTDTQVEMADEAALRGSIQYIENFGGLTFENKHRCKNGDILLVEISARMLNLSGKRLLVGVWRDITERKRADDAIRESENKYRSLFETAGDGIFLLNAKGFIDCNGKGAAMYGLTRNEVIGRTPVALAPERQPDGRLSSEMADEMIAAAMNGQSSQFEWRALRADGSALDVEINLNRIEYNEEPCLQAVVRDISERKEAELKLQQSEAHFRFVTESAQALIWMAGPDRLCTWFNKVWLNFTGRSMEQERGDGWAEGVHPDDLAQCLDIYNRHFERREPFSMEYRLRRHDGEHRWIVDNGSPRFNALGAFEGYIGSCFDITERRRDEENLRITASVFDTTQEAIIITDADNFITDVNPAFARITGYSREDALGRNPKFLSSGRHDRNFYAQMWQTIKERKSWRGEIWNRRKNGETYAELLSISAICGTDGKVQRHVGVFSDISYIKEYEAELSRVAHYDALTGIPNRVLLADRMKQAIAQTSREGDMMAVCYLDLDGFKPVNDTLGHEAGDQVLMEIARRIGHTIRSGDTVARLGGDEFVVLLLGMERGDECLATLERMLSVISEPMEIKGKPVTLGASIGVSIYPLDNENPDTLLRHADQAMYVAKQSGKNRYHIYDPELDLRARTHYEFLYDIRNALEHGQFELYYQPQLALESGKLTGAEALLRWRHAERGLLLPGDFLPVVENNDLSVEIGEWVIAEALEQLERWRQQGLDIEVSINISAYHLESPSFVENLQRHLSRHPDIPHGRLQIEVLETAALKDTAVVHELIEACRSLGVRFALDDFGTGYSSLSYLSNLPVDTLKIDQSFVRDMLEDSGDRAIVQGVIALAGVFGRETVAEGIESEAQYRALLEMGCKTGQGYGIARPMPASQLVGWRRS